MVGEFRYNVRMNIDFDVQTDIAKALAKLHRLDARQFPFIVALALNRTAKKVKDAERKVMESVFDRPKPFTLNSLQTQAATKETLVATIRLRDFAGKGTPAAKYLNPVIEGGGRRYKAFERALVDAGIMPNGMYAVPAKAYPLDQYGGVPGSVINRMLSYLRANRDATQNRATDKTRSRNNRTKLQFFAVNRDDPRGLPWGIYERKYGKDGSSFQLMFAFVKQPVYSKLYPFHRSAEHVTRLHLIPELHKAAEQALNSSRDAGFSMSDLASMLPR